MVIFVTLDIARDLTETVGTGEIGGGEINEKGLYDYDFDSVAISEDRTSSRWDCDWAAVDLLNRVSSAREPKGTVMK